MRIGIRALAAVSLLGLLALAGCYTVLSHPAGSDIVAGGGYAGAGYYQSCADCHADAAFYHPYYHYGRSHYRWGDYYGFPWWYDDYWWWHPQGEGEEGPPVETGVRHLWGSGGGGTKGWSFVLPPSSPPPTETRRDDDGTGQRQPEPQKQDDKEKDKEDGERHLWTPKKKGF